MKTITVPRELKFSDKTPGMTTLEEALFDTCKLQKEVIETLTPYAIDAGFEDKDLLSDTLFTVNKAMDDYRITVCRLKLEETE